MKRFLPYLRYLRGRRIALFTALFCGAISGLVYGWGLPKVLNEVFPRIFVDASGHAGAVPQLMPGSHGTAATSPSAPAQDVAQVQARRTLSRTQVVGYALLLPMIFLIRAVSGFLNNYLMSYCGVGVLEAIRVELYRKLQHLSLGYMGRNRTGDLLSRLTSDTQIVQQTITTSSSDLVIQPMTLLGAIFFLAKTAIENQGVGLFLASLAAVPAIIFPVRLVGRNLLRRAEENQALLGDITDLASQNMAAAREVRAFGLEEHETSRFQEASRRLFKVQMKVVKYSQVLSPTIEVVASLGIAFSLYYAYYAGISLTVFVSILAALFVCYEPMKKLGNLHGQLTRGAASLTRIEEILHEPIAVADPVDPVTVTRLRGDLTFRDVSFSYAGDAVALANVAVSIPAGTVCALVGPSGAGKSTFVNLVPRFYEASAGAVSLDGIDVRSMRLADLRRNIALVSQEPVLFNDTIYRNLLLGRADATRDEVMTAAIAAHADEFIRQLPQGYETVVGERGALLSGGQKQRIAIARAFLRQAPILILDEATSALDSESEAAIQDALRHLVVGKTVLIIAHRFSTIRDASMILVFDKGQVIAQGDHATLYASNTLYRSLYDRQTSPA
ncbi:MAG TPA: ABC transporter ATP-binding protein [Candidatus Didemnitutus sp.]|nr:ABC transporter ATP-binding protein [Candidatus Didemnitutus sp.]